MGTADSISDQVIAQCKSVAPESVRAFLGRIDPEYLSKFDPKTICSHIRALSTLSADEPAAVILQQSRGLIDCTILAFDHPFEFSSITGLMAGTGFSIESSDAYTLARIKQTARPVQPLRRSRLRKVQRDPSSDAVILDRFRGRLVGPIDDFKQWSRQFESELLEVLRLLDRDDDESTSRAKRLVVERVTQWLKSRREISPRVDVLTPAQAAIEQLPQATRLRLRAPDAPAFLYALSTSLSLHGLQIQRTRIETIDGHAVDEIDVVDAFGKPLVEADRVEQLRLSMLLTQQFVYFLDRSPDPFSALRRFEELSEKIVQLKQRGQWLALLSNPLSMIDLAKVLGASEYLWEDFIRFQAESLLPVFREHVRGRDVCPPARSLPRRLEESLKGAKTIEEQRTRLNEFKERELFLIDLDHILSTENADAAFQILSERLVMLAENLVATSARVVYTELLRLYGQPRDEKRRDVSFAIFGLGKLGGVALGYASDIELLFLFGSSGRTTGGTRGSLTNDEFFAILTRETSDFIQAKREGIFQVDLRLRPYGSNGPLACSRGQFAEYYGPKGAAHPFERLALVRLRWIAGDPRLGFEIDQLRDKLLFEGPPLDLDAIWDICGKMRKQHLEGRKLNSKYSPGALTDLEATVQLLQVTHAKDVPQLRTPRLTLAIQGLYRARVLSPIEFEQLLGAYQFLRRLINAQRVLRGSAQDLLLPPAESDELVHLGRRMNYARTDDGANEAELLVRDFQMHTKNVQQFIKRHLRRGVPGA
jgi:[glutamine synthetase] adenylyltransferase / [glutamine synthetase]-adenylyl-L-tyrosine phosphorylase